MTYPSFNSGEVLTASDMNAVGLWKVGSGTLSLTTTATNVTGVFSSTYKNYRLIYNVTARSTTSRIDMRYIIGTTPTSSGYYQGGLGGDYASNTVLYYQRSNNDPQFFGQSNADKMSFSMDIFRPNVASRTNHTGGMVDVYSGYAYTFGGLQNSDSQFTGFQLFTSTGTATVEYQIFGYRD